MKIVIAPQAFKGTLTGEEAARAIEKGILRANPSAITMRIPVADGGDGTLDILTQCLGGEIRHESVHGPLGEMITAPWGYDPKSSTAIIELAKVCGLALLPKEKRDPKKTTTYGVGQLIQAALNAGCQRILVGIGGSATNDAGVGIAQALGGRFLNQKGSEIGIGGQALLDLDHIDLSQLDLRIHECDIQVGCDVTNPLLGTSGAAQVYAPQKGATAEDVVLLEKALEIFSEVTQSDLNIDVREIPGGGAAGGTGAGMTALLGAKLVQGIDLVLLELNFSTHLAGADLVITGEGCMDAQTTYNN